jgi:hypothetical protein
MLLGLPERVERLGRGAELDDPAESLDGLAPLSGRREIDALLVYALALARLTGLDGRVRRARRTREGYAQQQPNEGRTHAQRTPSARAHWQVRA